ncbi:MAG: PorT family protein, partial [Muribaculaceae bacterium]|nr:PorT family protein [Muribaculaceae bacterium]
GSRDIHFREVETGATQRQNIKSTYVMLPLDLKFESASVRHARPDVTAGVMPAFDVAKKRTDLLKLKSSDFFLSIGFGCDFYLPYFKFIPEIKFCLGLPDMLQHDRPDLADDPGRLKFTQSLTKATSKMIVFTFYFE